MLSRPQTKLRLLGNFIQRNILSLRSVFASLSSVVPQRITPKEESRHEQAGKIIDLFATIVQHIGRNDFEKLDSTIDLLRYHFPNVEHSWILNRFENAYRTNYPLEACLTLAAAHKTKPELLALSLEIYATLHILGKERQHDALFEKICQGLNLHEIAGQISELITNPKSPAPHPIESLSFSSRLGESDFMLNAQEEGIRFRALRCVNLLLIINDGEQSIKLRGHRLHKGSILTIAENQSICLKRSRIDYSNIIFLMQAKYSGVKLVSYLQLDGDSLSITRQRSIHSLVRARFGTYVDLEILRRDAHCSISDIEISPDGSITTGYSNPFKLRGQGPFYFADVTRRNALDRSFQLDPKERKILVTNLRSMNRPGALMLTPGLASGCVFEVSYSSDTNTGELHILEGCDNILIDGQALRSKFVELKDGDLINLSPEQSLRCRFRIGILEEESGSIQKIVVDSLTKDYSRTGRVIDNISFSLNRGEMACIIGPSGSGKSTLLALLAGHIEANLGSIRYNGTKLTPQARSLRRHIAYIPREDILDEAMTVGEHIYQASIVRHPKLNKTDRVRRVMAILNFVGLSHLSQRNVGRAGARTISDGERTRVNLGLDLTGTAEVYLIDEPISGLSSADSERVIQTLDDMSNSRILICTLHRPSFPLLQRFKKVMVLDAKGHMAFWGSPDEMMRYFEKAAEEHKLIISPESHSIGGADYVLEVLDAPNTMLKERTNLSDNFWQSRFENKQYHDRAKMPDNVIEIEKNINYLPSRKLIELWRLFTLWLTRSFLSRMRSRMGLYTILLEGPVLAILISGSLRVATELDYTFYKSLHIGEYIFLSLILAMFFGLTNAACEILRDRPIIKRESNYKLFISGYILSKILVLTFIASIQCALYLLVSNAILNINSMFWPHFGVMVLTAFVGITLSLMISSIVRSERVALNIVPLLLVPQILLAGAMIKFEDMNDITPKIPEWLLPASLDYRLSNLRHRVAYQDKVTHNIETKPIPLIAEFCPLRYAFELMFVVQTDANLWEKESDIINKKREYLKKYGDPKQLRFIQRAVLALNSVSTDAEEARRILRRVRKAALANNEKFFDELSKEQEQIRKDNPKAMPLEFFYTNRKLTELKGGIKSARKDARRAESRGFFLSPQQAKFSSSINHSEDDNTVPTIWRNVIYLFLMGCFPILICGWQLRRITRGYNKISR